jgi:hypothetical protein
MDPLDRWDDSLSFSVIYLPKLEKK